MQIKDVISNLRLQLEALDEERRSADLPSLFSLSSVEVELSFIVRESDDDKIGFDIKVISANMGGSQAQESIQKMKIILIPTDQDAADGLLGTRFQRIKTSTTFEPLK
ncbi:trypco2 family protein [Rhizobium leguminosarum]|uniref:trypco2 family protein n=1 Tax=Rhizobium leguminosarum TaxID=384 RepID=UPI001C93F9AB|nr:trypco2 family protein [Rhizobium leguminosarum]MBY5524446.1 hypothetical protein [Rhizobium leguminosarum]